MKTQSPLVSVIIPNHNYARHLPAAIESVLAQTYEALEVLVVDDGSTDASRLVADVFGSRIRWFSQENQGVSAARNFGILHARGEWIAFLDADDEWYSRKLEHQILAATASDSGVAFTGVEFFDEASRSLGFEIPTAEGHVLREIAMLRTPVPAPASTLLVKYSILREVGEFDRRLSTSADWDFLRRLSCRTTFAAVRAPLVRYRLHAGGMHLNVDLLERDMLLAFQKMFLDPSALEVHALKRRCYGRLYAMLSGSFLHAGNWQRALTYALRSVLVSPRILSYIAGTPLRIARRARDRRAWGARR